MANKKISELQSRTPALSDLMLVGDPSSGYSYKCTVTALATIIETDIADGYVTIGTTQTISGAKTFSNNLTLTSVVNTPTDPDKFLTLNASNVVTYRTGSQVLSDIGAADDSLVVHLAGTETITGYKTFSSFAGFDSAISIKQNSTIVSQTGYGSIAASSTGFFLTRATGIHAFFNLNSLTTGRNFTFPDVTGTIALTSDITDALAGYVPTSRTLTINGVTQSLAANRTFNVGTVETVNFATGTTGTDVNVSGSPITTTGTITLNIPTASATNRGALSSTDWSTFNNKQSAISLTTTGNSGAATFVSNTLNIPNYTLSGLGGISGSGTTNYIPKFTSSSAIGNSTIQTDATGNLMVGSSDAGNAGTINVSVGVAGTTAGGLQLWASNSQTHYIQFGDGTTGGQTYAGFLGYAHSADALVFGTATSERMRLTSGGSLGIGTSSPVSTLDVNGAGVIRGFLTTTDAIKLGGNTSAPTSTDAFIYRPADNTLAFGTASSERMRLDASGNLGLGTSSPSERLEVSASNVMVKLNAATNTFAQLGYYENGSLKWNAYNDYNTDNYVLGNSGGSRLFLTQDGNLGLGVTPSAWVSSRKAFEFGNVGKSISGGGNVTEITLGGNAYDAAGGWTYANTAQATLYQQYDGLHTWLTAPSGTAGNAISWTQAMTLDASGRLGIGTTTINNRVEVAGTIASTTTTTNPAFRAILPGNANAEILFSYSNPAFGWKWVQDEVSTGDLMIKSRESNVDATRMYFQRSTGNVGIGTTSPSTRLDVNGVGTFQTGFQVVNGGTGLSFAASRLMGQMELANLFRMYITGQDASTKGGLEIYNATSTGSPTIGLAITAASNVGIGTTSPTSKLEVEAAAGSVFRVVNAGTNEIEVGNFSSGNGYQQLDIVASTLMFGTGTAGGGSATERMRITSGGNVGIGTTSPTRLLDVSTTNPQMTLKSTTTTGFSEYYFSDSAGDPGFLSYAHNGDYLVIGVNSSERMRITSGGNVGIGTTNPTVNLQIEKSSASYVNVNNTTGANIFLGAESTTGLLAINNNYPLEFRTNNVERMRITSGGNVGIGTSSPTSSTNYTSLVINGSTGSELYMNGGGTNYGYIYANSGNFVMSSVTSIPLVFQINGSEKARINTGGELLINTTSDAGDYKLQVNGNVYVNGQQEATSFYTNDTRYISNQIQSGYNTNAEDSDIWINYTGYQGGTTRFRDFRVGDGKQNEIAFFDGSTKNVVFGGSIKTAAPSGGTAAAWKLGERVASSGLTLNDTQYIQLDIAGTLYTLATVNLP